MLPLAGLMGEALGFPTPGRRVREPLHQHGFVCFNGDVGRVMLLALLALYAPEFALASVEVKQDGTRVSVRAEAAPLSEVLDQLSRQLGMSVVYEGAPPQSLVNASLANRTPAEAVLSVLEGLGLNYLARMDVTGTRVEHLVIAGAAPAAGAAQAAAPAPATSSATARSAPAVPDGEEDPVDEEEDLPAVGPSQPPRPMVGGRPRGLQPGVNQPDSPPSRMLPAGNAPASYPVSPFAPQAPAPPSVIAAPPIEPVDESGEDAEVQ